MIDVEAVTRHYGDKVAAQQRRRRRLDDHPGSNTLAPWAGFAAFRGWAALAIAIAAVLMVRRDT